MSLPLQLYYVGPSDTDVRYHHNDGREAAERVATRFEGKESEIGDIVSRHAMQASPLFIHLEVG